MDVYTRWTQDEISGDFITGEEFASQTADAALKRAGWVRKSPWSGSDADSYTCEVFTRTPLPFLTVSGVRALEDELRLLDKAAGRIREQLAILHGTEQ